MTKSKFEPSALQAPALPSASAGLKGYIEYISCWDVYCLHLKSTQAKWKQGVKDDVAAVKAASARGCVVKTSFAVKMTQDEKKEVVGGELVPRKLLVGIVNKTRKEVPQVVTPPKSKEAKAAGKIAKRRRNRQNRALRKAKTQAKLSLWQLRAENNGKKLEKVARKSKPARKGKLPSPVPKVEKGKSTVPKIPEQKPEAPTETPKVTPVAAQPAAPRQGAVGFASQNEMVQFGMGLYRSRFPNTPVNGPYGKNWFERVGKANYAATSKSAVKGWFRDAFPKSVVEGKGGVLTTTDKSLA